MPVSLLCSTFFYDKFDTFKKTLMTDDFPSSFIPVQRSLKNCRCFRWTCSLHNRQTIRLRVRKLSYRSIGWRHRWRESYVVAIVVFILLVLAAVGFSYRKKNPQNPIVDNGEPTIGIRREEWRENCNFRRRGCDYSAGALKEDTQIFITKIADGPVTDLYKIEPEGLNSWNLLLWKFLTKKAGLNTMKRLRILT